MSIPTTTHTQSLKICAKVNQKNRKVDSCVKDVMMYKRTRERIQGCQKKNPKNSTEIGGGKNPMRQEWQWKNEKKKYYERKKKMKLFFLKEGRGCFS